MKQRLLELAESLEEIADFDEEANFSDLGDWFMSSGSGSIDMVASELRSISEGIVNE